MSALHLVRIAIDHRALMAFAVARRLSDDDLGYALHLALRLRFGDAAPQPFRFEEPPRQAPFLIGYAAQTAPLDAAYALPPTDAALEAIFPAAPEYRPMPESWAAGARFRFKVRVRPLVRYGKNIRKERARTASDQMFHKAGEVDAFIAACNRAGPDDPTPDRETVYRHWLESRLAPAATLESARLEQMKRISTKRSRHRDKDAPPRDKSPATRLSESSEAIFTGTLQITDPRQFARLLAGGIGRHKAFGFGMLTLAPPGPMDRP